MRGAWTKPAPAGGESSPPLSEGQEPQAQSVGGALHEWPVIRNMSQARRTQAPGREPDDAAVSEGCDRYVLLQGSRSTLRGPAEPSLNDHRPCRATTRPVSP